MATILIEKLFKIVLQSSNEENEEEENDEPHHDSTNVLHDTTDIPILDPSIPSGTSDDPNKAGTRTAAAP